jgi:hypothetical protein
VYTYAMNVSYGGGEREGWSITYITVETSKQKLEPGLARCVV